MAIFLRDSIPTTEAAFMDPKLPPVATAMLGERLSGLNCCTCCRGTLARLSTRLRWRLLIWTLLAW
jgi:hypothetical protein